MTAGVTNVRLPRFTEEGSHELSVRYVEGGTVLAQRTVTVRVLKAASDIRVLRGKAVAGKKAILEVTVKDAEAGLARGWVRIKLDGDWRAARLEDGRARFDLGRLAAGKRKIVVKYTGNDSTASDREVVRYRVRRR